MIYKIGQRFNRRNGYYNVTIEITGTILNPNCGIKACDGGGKEIFYVTKCVQIKNSGGRGWSLNQEIEYNIRELTDWWEYLPGQDAPEKLNP